MTPWWRRWRAKTEPAPAPVATAPGRQDSLVAAQAFAPEVLAHVMNALKDERGIHLESLFCALGALAGHACQASVIAQARAAGKPPEAFFDVATTTDGGRFYFGDALNRPLAEDRLSVWSLLAGAASHAGATQLPDLNEIFAHNATVLGSAKFGLPRLPAAHPLQATPISYARKLWPQVQPMIRAAVPESRFWPVTLALAIQEAMAQTRGVLPPELVVKIVMESAIPVSKTPIKD